VRGGYIEFLYQWEARTAGNNVVLTDVLEEARHILMLHELPRAREELSGKR
jgi:hypothetical protein